ncbi:MAG: hypothetical protein QOC99_1910 [Acidobacteriota bacterium]|jgi:ribosomal protein S15P/S13E|nr:hypothetical protein [Acidobacteriota bacterium]
MTNEEMERAIDFLLKNQAKFDVRLEQTNEQGARTDERVSRLADQVAQLAIRVEQLTDHLNSFADTQANIMRVMTQTFESQTRINESLRATLTKLDARQERTEESQTYIDESLRAAVTGLAAKHGQTEETQTHINESLRAAIGELASKQGRTEESLAQLTQKVDKLADAQVGTDRRLDALIRIVEEGRNGR